MSKNSISGCWHCVSHLSLHLLARWFWSCIFYTRKNVDKLILYIVIAQMDFPCTSTSMTTEIHPSTLQITSKPIKETRETSVNLVSMNCLLYGILLHVRPLQYCIFISNLSSSQYSVLRYCIPLSLFLSLSLYISPIIPCSSDRVKEKSRVKRKRK